MTSTYGKAGGPTTQMVREGMDATTASHIILPGDGTTTQVILAAATGDDYYLIWGVTVATTDVSDAQYGYIESTDGAEDIAAFAVTAHGPMSMMMSQPVRLAPLQGVNCTMAATIATGEKVLPMVYYTLVSP